MEKLELTSRYLASLRNQRAQTEWKVPTLEKKPLPQSPSIRSTISRAALLVKVTAKICERWAKPDCKIQAMRLVNTVVLPLPAPAKISKGPSVVVTASACCGFSPVRIDSIVTESHPFINHANGLYSRNDVAKR